MREIGSGRVPVGRFARIGPPAGNCLFHAFRQGARALPLTRNTNPSGGSEGLTHGASLPRTPPHIQPATSRALYGQKTAACRLKGHTMKRNLQINFTDTAAHALTFRVRTHASRLSRTGSFSHPGHPAWIQAVGHRSTAAPASGGPGGVTTHDVPVAPVNPQTAEAELEKRSSPIPSLAVSRIADKN